MKCGLQGDVNGDGVVNVLELARVGAAFGSSLGSPNYDADLDKDGAVNVLDLVLVEANSKNPALHSTLFNCSNSYRRKTSLGKFLHPITDSSPSGKRKNMMVVSLRIVVRDRVSNDSQVS